MRVISGRARGLKLESPEGLNTRPTLDRVREAVFSMLFAKIPECAVLDLFAGSGALGIEALSRYAGHCTFVDNNSAAEKVVRSNICKAGFSDCADIILGDSIEFLKTTNCKYDIVFLDPPYKAGLYEDALGVIKERGLLNIGGLIIAECSRNFSFEPRGYNIIKDKTYGKVRIYILEDAAHNE